PQQTVEQLFDQPRVQQASIAEQPAQQAILAHQGIHQVGYQPLLTQQPVHYLLRCQVVQQARAEQAFQQPCCQAVTAKQTIQQLTAGGAVSHQAVFIQP